MRTDHILSRFFNKIDFQQEHDIWIGAVSSSGHGLFYLKEPRIVIGAHVFAYEFYNGIEAKFDVHHTCDIKLCVRKEHLEDIYRSTHMTIHHGYCKRGHDLTKVGQNKSGACKKCVSNYNRSYIRRDR